MSPIPSGKKRFMRWYDKVPALGFAVEIMETMPSNIRVMLAQATNSFINREGWKNKHTDGQLKQIGRDKILGLMKSKKKLRWYDQNAEVHQAFNELYLLGYQECQLTSIRIIVSIGQLQKQGLEWLSTEECVRFVDEIFNCDTLTLLEKAKNMELEIPGVMEAPASKKAEKVAAQQVDVKQTTLVRAKQAVEESAQKAIALPAETVEPEVSTVNKVSDDGERVRSLDSVPISLKHLSKTKI
jgi:hypothetical protein